jgi:glutathione S-transferase
MNAGLGRVCGGWAGHLVHWFFTFFSSPHPRIMSTPSPLKLTIGNYNYSSWSMRPWVALTAVDMPFTTQVIELDSPAFAAHVPTINPAGKVPVLHDGVLAVWDTLAIIEYAYENYPAIWPADKARRARARSLCAQMHSGFTAMRNDMPMIVDAHLPGKGHTAGALADVAAISALWKAELAAHGGPFLFGQWCAADAYFAPVVLRFTTYAPPVSARVQAYMSAVKSHPATAQWIERGMKERIYIAKDEPYRSREQAGY